MARLNLMKTNKRWDWSLALLSFWAVSFLFMAIYAVENAGRPRQLHYAYFSSIVVGIVTALLLIYFFVFEFLGLVREKNVPYLWLANNALMTAAIFYVVVTIYFCAASIFIVDSYRWIRSMDFSQNNAVFGASVVVLLIGSLLFFFRLRFRSLYGLAEVVSGVATAAYRVSAEDGVDVAMGQSGFYLAILTASVYLIVRGLDNFHQGLVNDPKDPVVTRMLEWTVRGKG